MTRAEFMARLRKGLVGLPTAAAADIAADYGTHLADGAAAGPSEAELAAPPAAPHPPARRPSPGARNRTRPPPPPPSSRCWVSARSTS